MGLLRVLSQHGDDRFTWDQTAAMTGDAEAELAVREAQHIFDQQRERGAVAVVARPEGSLRRIDHFDPEAEQIIMVPRVVGG
jgi:hypothetical protein